jgi:transposase-like protein
MLSVDEASITVEDTGSENRQEVDITFFIDEVFVTNHGKQHYPWRAVDQDGEVVVYLQARRGATGQQPSGSSSACFAHMTAIPGMP